MNRSSVTPKPGISHARPPEGAPSIRFMASALAFERSIPLAQDAMSVNSSARICQRRSALASNDSVLSTLMVPILRAPFVGGVRELSSVNEPGHLAPWLSENRPGGTFIAGLSQCLQSPVFVRLGIQIRADFDSDHQQT